jgi:hypothetical protein
MSFNDEFLGLTAVEKKIVKLSIKYQIDLMSMTIEEVSNILTLKDWKDLHDFMKNGGRERVLH